MFKYYAKHQHQNAIYQVWQKTNNPIELWSSKVIDQKIEYPPVRQAGIHNNPVNSGILLSPESYNYSSANVMDRLAIIRA